MCESDKRHIENSLNTLFTANASNENTVTYRKYFTSNTQSTDYTSNHLIDETNIFFFYNKGVSHYYFGSRVI